ncbi:MAG: OapB/ArvB family protein [Candidatus Woesearchaeota archaeon]
MIKIRYLSISRLSSLDMNSKIDLILEHAKNNEIMIIDGRLKSREEAELIRRTMVDLGENFEVFNGLEMASLYDNNSHGSGIRGLFKKKSGGITIIGPAAIIDEMKHHPNHIELKVKK